MSEYQVGDKAHLNKKLKVRGFLNYNTEQEKHKDFAVDFQSPVKIKAILSNDKAYSVIYKDGDKEYLIESITEKDLYTKATWEKAEEQSRILTELTKTK